MTEIIRFGKKRATNKNFDIGKKFKLILKSLFKLELYY